LEKFFRKTFNNFQPTFQRKNVPKLFSIKIADRLHNMQTMDSIPPT